jgi:putative ABC transport system permease protein
MDGVLQDLRYALRGLWRSRAFAAITILTLGLGIGVVTALFAVVQAVLFHPIVPAQDRVARIWMHQVDRGEERVPLSYPEFRAMRDQARTLEGLAAINYADALPVPVAIEDQTSAVALAPVSANFFSVLRAGHPLRGRWLAPADELPGTELVAVVSERFWRRAAAGDPAFVGRRLRFAGEGRTLVVVGIAPADFDYPLGADMWVPIARFFAFGMGAAAYDVENRQIENRNFFQFELIGRLADGVSFDQARTELSAVHGRFAADVAGEKRNMRVVVTPLLDTVLGNSAQILRFLFGAAGLVFVIAGVNVAALLLMRASGRLPELAVRVALGAGRAQLARQVIAESIVLGVSSVLSGFLIARLCLAIVPWIGPDTVPRIEHAAIDGRVLGFCISAALAWVLVLGTVPSWGGPGAATAGLSRRFDVSLRGVRGTRGLRWFTIAEIAAAVVIAIGAALLVRSFIHLQSIDRGLRPDNLTAVRILLPESRYPDKQTRLDFYNRLLARVEAIPGVIAASTVHLSPGSGMVGLSAPMRFEGQTPGQAETNPLATWEPTTPTHFRAMGIPIVGGRGFTDADDRNGSPVAIVSEDVARRYWPEENPIGKRLKFVDSAKFPWVTVVGVAGDMRYRQLTKSWMTVYFPADQFFFFQPGGMVIRTASNAQAIIPSIRQTVRAQEPLAAITSIEAMDTLLARELSRPRAALAVTGAFALLAIVLSAVGVYGVMSYEVRERRRELAVRSALGAGPADIFRVVVRRSVGIGAAGAALGVTTAAVVTRSVRSLLFQVEPTDPTAFLTGTCALLTIVLAASLVPARRAAAADPAAVLRAE